MRGPSLAEVGAHVNKIVNYRALTRVEAEQPASVQLPLPATGEPTREAESPAESMKRAA